MIRSPILTLASLFLCLASAGEALAQKGKIPVQPAQNMDATADAELALGNAAADRKEWAKAKAHYTKALGQKSDLVPAFLGRGRVSLADGKLDDALADFRKASELAPDLPAAHTWLAAAYLDKGEHDASHAAASQALKLDAKVAFAWYIRGTALIHKGEFARAIDDLSEAAKLVPNDAVIYNNRGIAYEKLGDAKSAAADFQRRDQLNGKSSTADTQSAQERLKRAEQEYQTVNKMVEAHEDRIRLLLRIPVRPGVPRPRIEPVPPELLQRRAAAWNALQQAIRAVKQTP